MTNVVTSQHTAAEAVDICRHGLVSVDGGMVRGTITRTVAGVARGTDPSQHSSATVISPVAEMLIWLGERMPEAPWRRIVDPEAGGTIVIVVDVPDDDAAIALSESAGEMSIDLLLRTGEYVCIVPRVRSGEPNVVG